MHTNTRSCVWEQQRHTCCGTRSQILLRSTSEKDIGSPSRAVLEQHPGNISTTAVTKGALLLPMQEHTEHRTQYLVVMRLLPTHLSPDFGFKVLERWEMHLQFVSALRFASLLISPLLLKLSPLCGCLPC